MSISITAFETKEQWAANRINGIGGSEISAVIGQNPYMTNTQLWEYKTKRRAIEDISDKPYVKYGNAAEHHLRELFKLDYPELNVEYMENNCFTNTKYPFAQASLDGWIYDEKGRFGILEIKTTEILRSMQKEKWNNRIPMNYYCQILYYMAVTEAEFAILKAQLKYEIDGEVYLQTKHYRIERSDVRADMDYLMAEGAKFWEYVKNDKRPPLVLGA